MTSFLTFALLLLLLLFQVSCFTIPPAPLDLLFEDKTRLGSRPPSCHSKCNGCLPCMAVQVPSIPSHDPVRPGFKRNVNDFFDSGNNNNNRYSNYKPLGWKCRCAGHFYNP